MCSSPVVSVTRVTSWLHHHVIFFHSRFIIAVPFQPIDVFDLLT